MDRLDSHLVCPSRTAFYLEFAMSDQALEKHQLAGFDTRERGFSRPIVFEFADGGYHAILRYETTRVVTIAQATPGAALEELIRMLQGQGYSQLRSQLSVRKASIWVLKSLGLSIRTRRAVQSQRAGG